MKNPFQGLKRSTRTVWRYLSEAFSYEKSLSGIETDLETVTSTFTDLSVMKNPFQGLKLHWGVRLAMLNFFFSYEKSLSGIETDRLRR